MEFAFSDEWEMTRASADSVLTDLSGPATMPTAILSE